MNTKHIALLLAVVVFSLACQGAFPARTTGTPVSGCADAISGVSRAQAADIPDYLLETGVRQGGELDVNRYFDSLTHISMHPGYALDYIYQSDDLGAYPVLYARRADQAPYASAADIPENTQLPDYHEYVDVEDIEQGYFEYVVLDIMADQFYLSWHANYNDMEIVCNSQQVDDIVERVSSGDFGSAMDLAQQTRARLISNIEPTVSLTDSVARVQVLTFTKWGGFYRLTYTIDRGTPHTVEDVSQENLVPYDCGVAF